MKSIVKYLYAFILLLVPMMMHGQGAEGYWKGTLEMPGNQTLDIFINIAALPDGTLAATFDVPAQGARGVPFDSVKYEEGLLTIDSDALDMHFSGLYLLGNFSGKFIQRGFELPLLLSRSEKPQPNRPQTPVAPFPYAEEEVRFVNERDNVTLGGTLTMPKNGTGLHAVVLVSGSGSQDRDEALFDHRPFAVIADHLTRRGIAVLRYDDRGVGASEAGTVIPTTMNLSYDAEAAVDYLLSRPEVAKVSVVGHSEGGMIAYMIAARRSDDISSIVSMAGPAVRCRDLLVEQTKAVMMLQGYPEEIVAQSVAINSELYDEVVGNASLADAEFENAIVSKLKSLLGTSAGEETIQQYKSQLCNPWMRYFLAFDPAEYLEKVKCPMLFIDGTKDCQVVSSQNVPAMRKHAEINGNICVEEMEGLNHLFQHAKRGSVDEYYEIEETISPEVLEMIAAFLGK